MVVMPLRGMISSLHIHHQVITGVLMSPTVKESYRFLLNCFKINFNNWSTTAGYITLRTDIKHSKIKGFSLLQMRNFKQSLDVWHLHYPSRFHGANLHSLAAVLAQIPSAGQATALSFSKIKTKIHMQLSIEHPHLIQITYSLIKRISL